MTSRGAAQSTTASQPAGSNAQGERKTTAGNSQTKTAYSSRSTSPHASASSPSQNASSSATSNNAPPTGTNSRQTSSSQSSANASSGTPRQAGATSSGNPSGQGTSSRPAVGPSITRQIQTGTACVENIQILAIPIAANRYQVWKSGPTGKRSLERLELLAGRAGARVYASSAALERGCKRPDSAT